jgi:hypothetical protein
MKYMNLSHLTEEQKKQRRKEQQRAWRDTHREQKKSYDRNWVADHREQMNATKRKYKSKYYSNKYNYIVHQAEKHLVRLYERGLKSTYNLTKIPKYLNVTCKEFAMHIQSCGGLSPGFEICHIIPFAALKSYLESRNLSTDYIITVGNCLDNIKVMSTHQNQIDGARITPEAIALSEKFEVRFGLDGFADFIKSFKPKTRS